MTHTRPHAFAPAAMLATALAAPLLLFVTPATAQSSANGCEAPRANTGRSIGRSILGRAVGDLVGRATGNLGYASRFVPSAEVADTMTDAIACHLDPQEQRKAADATVEATRSGEVGASASWTSDTRANVSGTSIVTARDDGPNGSGCMLVDDIIIVNGEETRGQKRMCRVPPSPRYTLAA